ncbi:MAG: DUF2490 domain-containing protein [Pseudomonadota bacterium]
MRRDDVRVLAIGLVYQACWAPDRMGAQKEGFGHMVRSWLQSGRSFVVVCVITCFGTLVAASTPAKAEDSFQLWSALFVNGPVKDDSNLLLWFDGHARSMDGVDGLGVSILRPGVGYRLSDNLSGWVGYARVEARQDGAPDVIEDRIWQQATYNFGTVLGGRLSGRSRLEQRFFNTGSDTAWRWRQFFRYDRPFVDTPFRFVLWNETFIDLNDTDFGIESGFGQNRTFIGAGWQFSKPVRVEAGYLFNPISVPNAADLDVNIFSINLFVPL